MIREFLFDEHLPKKWRKALVKQGVTGRIRYVGDPGAPPCGSPDPDLLKWCEEQSAALITNNRGSMAKHLADHLANGGHVPGIFIINLEKVTLEEMALDLCLLTGAIFPGEYEDVITYTPLT